MHKMHKHAPFPPAQSRPHLRTVKTTAEWKPFSGSMDTTLCDFW